ncbi:hypothetical protein FQZ97_903830 [compost metagenome]
MQGDVGTQALAQARVGAAHQGDGGDRRVLVEQVLDLHHRDVLATTDHHVLGAPGDADVTPLVHARQVAGGEPAVAVHAVQLGTLEVADEQAGATHHQVTLLAGGQRLALVVLHRDLHEGQGAAVGVNGAFDGIFRAGHGHGAVLGHAPGGDDARAQRIAGLLHQCTGYGRAGGDEYPKGGEGVTVLRRHVHQVGEEGR